MRNHAPLEEVVQAAEQAAGQAAIEANNAFVSLVTHELRVPLTSIRGYTDLLLKGMAGPLTTAQTDFLKTIRRNADRMDVLLRDLSEINHLETGRIHLELNPLHLPEIVQTVADELQEALQEQQQILTIEIPAAMPPVCADRHCLAQILTNLVINAHQYTPAGGAIAVCAATNGRMAAISVRDNGIGISPADQSRLYQPFFRSSVTAVREKTGWGLGLSLVKLLVEAQGGQIHLESALGQGSAFTFTIPLANRPDEAG